MDQLVDRAREYAGQAPKPAPAPTPAPASKPLGSSEGLPYYGARIDRRVRLTNWYVWSDRWFRTGKRTVTGDYKVVGITTKHGAEARLRIEDANGGRCWTRAIAAKDGLIN